VDRIHSPGLPLHNVAGLLVSAIKTIDQRTELMIDVITRFIFLVPKVSWQVQ
jgi:hypothetical protein